MSGRSIQARLKQIDALAKINEETIKQIDSSAATTVNLVTYVISCSNGTFSVNESKQSQQGNQVANGWRETIDLTSIPDIFNDKINYSCTTYQDLKRLNGEMLRVAQKYELFGDSEKAHKEIAEFENNFRIIQAALKRITELHRTGGSGHLANIQEQLDNVNNQIKALRTSYPNITFQQNQQAYPPITFQHRQHY
jgi:hypothetical protein